MHKANLFTRTALTLAEFVPHETSRSCGARLVLDTSEALTSDTTLHLCAAPECLPAGSERRTVGEALLIVHAYFVR